MFILIQSRDAWVFTVSSLFSQLNLDNLKKHACSGSKSEESNCYFCRWLGKGSLKSIVQSGHVYFKTEVEQY